MQIIYIICIIFYIYIKCKLRAILSHLSTSLYVISSAGQELIASKIKVFVYIIYKCVLFIFIMYI